MWINWDSTESTRVCYHPRHYGIWCLLSQRCPSIPLLSPVQREQVGSQSMRGTLTSVDSLSHLPGVHLPSPKEKLVRALGPPHGL